MAATTPPATNLEGEDAREGRSPMMPEDGYEWKKYGQKFIQNIRKNRSYFKCRNRRCKAKKRLEWLPSDPSSIRVIYQGAHDHPSPRPQSNLEQEASARRANRYNLANQVLGSPSDPS
ncbi:WRKY transcription factor 71-like [Phoenix dactylifera]|uniref:WRKY transcription factor 71-like n=1 Tax=Phoenix dactylifera TaxID=42345 RepID=A0A8B8JCL8_PHODC|nr:WRKY transcription factor 71-like [Phoenix dactylifera]